MKVILLGFFFFSSFCVAQNSYDGISLISPDSISLTFLEGQSIAFWAELKNTDAIEKNTFIR
jgi:hypothetical protein